MVLDLNKPALVKQSVSYESYN